MAETMNTDKVLALAREANLEKVDVVDGLFSVNVEGLQTFAALIQQQTIAEILPILENKVTRPAGHGGRWEGYGTSQEFMTGPECAAIIKERFKS